MCTPGPTSNAGAQVWQSFGGQQLGSIWGHGALSRPTGRPTGCIAKPWRWLDLRAQANSTRKLRRAGRPGDQAKLQAELQPDIARQHLRRRQRTITVSDERAQAIVQVAAHYISLFGSDDPATHALRETYAMRENTVPDAWKHRRLLTAFFFWTSGLR
jgi:nitric oxide reductase subunit B